MFVCAYGAKKGLQHIGSVAWIVLFYALVSIYLALVLSLQDSNIEGHFSYFGSRNTRNIKDKFTKNWPFLQIFLF